MFDTLVAVAPGSTEIVPSLAESWSISDDRRTYTFRLQGDVSFQSSEAFKPTRPMNAADVVFSFDLQRPDRTAEAGEFAEFRGDGIWKNVESVEAVDDRTVRFRLKAPSAPFLASLAMPLNAIQSAEYAHSMRQQGTPERFVDRPIGTGPFRLADYRPGIAIRYQAFEGHWDGRPPLDTLVFSITPSAAARLQKLRSGECHVAAAPAPADAEAIAADGALRLLSTPGLTLGYLAVNTTRKPFDDVRVRRALTMAIDRESILAAIYPGTGTLATGPLPQASWASDGAAAEDGYDPAEARRLLLEAGVTSGLKVDLWYPAENRAYNPDAKRMALMVAADLEPLGIKVEQKSAPWEEYWRRLMDGETTLAFAGWMGDTGDPDDFAATLLSCSAAKPGGTNIARWCDAGYDRLIEKARQETDRSVRAALYREAQQIFRQQAPFVPIASPEQLTAMRGTVENYVASPLGFHDFSAVDLAD
nr:ABC transporter substrate-binding protein [Jiella sonneratiae]